MRHILARQQMETLRQLAWSDVLLAFDFDGTLAPIVSDPAAAAMRPRTRELLATLTRRYRCAVISGRAQTDVLKRMRGVGVIEAIGNHGLEPSQYQGSFAASVRTWVPRLERQLADLKGIVIEDKVFSLAIHYRASREKRRARIRIQAALGTLGPIRVIGGKAVFNVLPKDAPHKGMALVAARARFRCDTALYVGDDDTDEDVFTLDEPGRLLTVRIGRSSRSHAQYYLRGQSEIDALFDVLAGLRAAGWAANKTGGTDAR